MLRRGRSTSGTSTSICTRSPAIRWEAAVGAATLADRHYRVVGRRVPRSSPGTRRSCSRSSCSSSRAASPPSPTVGFAPGSSCSSCSLGFVGGVRNVNLQRTAAGKVAAILRTEAKPGDVVLYCPDQVGPAVHRLAPPGLDEVTYPRLRRPALVDWVDYKKVLAEHKPAAVAQEVLARAGSRTIWYVSAPGYRTHVATCDAARPTRWPRPAAQRSAVGSDPTDPREAGPARVPGALTMLGRSRLAWFAAAPSHRSPAISPIAAVPWLASRALVLAALAVARRVVDHRRRAAAPDRAAPGLARVGRRVLRRHRARRIRLRRVATACASSRCSRSRVARSGCFPSSTRAAASWLVANLSALVAAVLLVRLVTFETGDRGLATPLGDDPAPRAARVRVRHGLRRVAALRARARRCSSACAQERWWLAARRRLRGRAVPPGRGHPGAPGARRSGSRRSTATAAVAVAFDRAGDRHRSPRSRGWRRTCFGRATAPAICGWCCGSRTTASSAAAPSRRSRASGTRSTSSSRATAWVTGSTPSPPWWSSCSSSSSGGSCRSRTRCTRAAVGARRVVRAQSRLGGALLALDLPARHRRGRYCSRARRSNDSCTCSSRVASSRPRLAFTGALVPWRAARARRRLVAMEPPASRARCAAVGRSAGCCS